MAQRIIKNQKPPANAAPVHKAKNQAAISLLEKWLADESGYDEKTWPIVKEAIESNRLSDRKRFNG